VCLQNGRTNRDALMQFRMPSRMGPGNRYIRWGVYWRHLANTTEQSVCGGDVALCRITPTTCLLLMQVENETAAVNTVVRGGQFALSKVHLLYWKQLVSDLQQLSSPRPRERVPSTTKPLR